MIEISLWRACVKDDMAQRLIVFNVVLWHAYCISKMHFTSHSVIFYQWQSKTSFQHTICMHVCCKPYVFSHMFHLFLIHMYSLYTYSTYFWREWIFNNITHYFSMYSRGRFLKRLGGFNFSVYFLVFVGKSLHFLFSLISYNTIAAYQCSWVLICRTLNSI